MELLYRLGRFAQADTLLAQVQDDAPLSPELGRLAADVALRVQDDDRALTLARQALTGRTNSSADQVWLGQLLLAAARQAENRRRPDQVRTRRLEAEQAFRRGIELAPDDPDARVALVAALAGWDRRDEARATIRAAEGHLKGPTGDLALARCFEAVGETDQAEAKLQALLKVNPDDPVFLRAAATVSLRAGKARAAEPTLRRLIALQNQSPNDAAWAKRVLALALAAEGSGGWLKARELVGIIDGTAAGSTAAASRTDPRADELRAQAQVLARQPGRTPRRQAIAILASLASRDEARPEDTFLRAQLLDADGDWKRARALAAQLRAENPSNAAILTFLARGEIASPTPDEATPWIDALAQLNVSPTLLTELRARLLFKGGKAPEAIASLTALARQNPQLGPAVAGLLEDARPPAAAESLLRSRDASSLTPDLRRNLSLTLATLLGRNNRHADALAICERLWAEPTVPPSQVFSVAPAALYTGQPTEAVLQRVEAGIEAALKRRPNDVVLRFDRANLLILRGRYAEFEAIFRAVHETQPRLGAPLNNLAWLLALRGEGKQALELIDRAVALDGPKSDLLDTRGLVLIHAGQPDRAIDDLAESIAAAPGAMNNYHLAQALQRAGRTPEAGEALAKARSAGLKASDIHPLERPGYLGLIAALPTSEATPFPPQR